MIIYNVTVSIEEDVHDDWLNWMKTVHIPDVMATGKFVDYQICKVLSQEDKGLTYAIQYRCKDMKTLHMYQVQDAPNLQKDHGERYSGKYVAFRSLLEVVDDNRNG